MRTTIILALALCSFSTYAQKKILDHPDFEIWNSIEGSTISPDGNSIMYSLEKGEKDATLKLKDGKGKMLFTHERSENGKFTYDSKFALFTIKAWKAAIVELII